MKLPPPFISILLLAATLRLGSWVQADVPEEMASAASRFLASLASEQRDKAFFADFGGDERKNWAFIPKARKGLPIKEMSPAQRALALGMVSTGLSQQGYLKAMTVISLEEILKELEQGKGPVRDSELYFVSIFGTPAKGKAWGWRFEGHHLALNYTVTAGGKISMTPSFFGSNPAKVLSGPREGLRTLAGEEDEGRKLVKMFKPDQLKTVIFDQMAPKDILSEAFRVATRLNPPGLGWEKMNAEQRSQLKQLVRVYLFRNRPEVAEVEWKRLETAGWKGVHFAWAGGVEPGQAHYYRVQSEHFLLEYDNIQNNNNHVHSVWRDFSNDFGVDILKEHYDRAPHK